MSMPIRDLFTKPIDRPINGVIKADQADTASVWQELEEYVVTKELDIHFRRFFGAYLDAIDHAGDPQVVGKVGVWISGFFGSGKSHFLKILSYLLENLEISYAGQTRRAIAFFDGKIQDAMLAADIKRAVGTAVDVCLFNIDSKADTASGRDAILRVFLKVFNEKLGYCGDHPHIADLERRLASQGKLDAFKAAFRTIANVDWESERDGYSFYADELVRALSEALGKTPEGARAWLERSEEDFKSLLTVENFAGWIKDYLDSRGPAHRICFLVDEIGQFIGQDAHLMLNLQTIAENLGTVCGGRAWVVVTSQEDIDAVLGEVRAAPRQRLLQDPGPLQDPPVALQRQCGRGHPKLKFLLFNHATKSITAAISGFRTGLRPAAQSIPKPRPPRSLASARRRSAKAYSVRLAVA